MDRGLARGNVPAAVTTTVIRLLAGSLLTPLYRQALLGAVVEIRLTQVARQVALIVLLSMALKAHDVLRAPQMLLSLLLPRVLMYVLNFALSPRVGRSFVTRGDAIARVYGTVMRNLSIVMAMAIGVFREQGAEAALLIALAYVVQVQAAAWHVRFTDRLFGRPAEAGAG